MGSGGGRRRRLSHRSPRGSTPDLPGIGWAHSHLYPSPGPTHSPPCPPRPPLSFIPSLNVALS
eukprot:7295128-Pyramimonas_sp.AAC.1